MLRYQRFCRLPQRFYIPEPFLSPAFLIQSGQRALGLCQPGPQGSFRRLRLFQRTQHQPPFGPR